MRLASFICIVLLAGLCACLVPSVHPLFSDEQLSYDPWLEGDWKMEADTWRFEPSDQVEKGYRLTVTQDKGQGHIQRSILIARRGMIGQEEYLDLFADLDAMSEQVNDVYLMHVTPTHSFWKIERKGEALGLRTLDYKKLETLLEEKKISVQHEWTAEREIKVLLTAPPAQLQKLMEENAEQILADPLNFTRVTPSPAPADAAATTSLTLDPQAQRQVCASLWECPAGD